MVAEEKGAVKQVSKGDIIAYKLAIISPYCLSMKTIILTHRAAKDLDALPVDARAQVADALIIYATTGKGDVRKVAGRDGYRMRAGSYRVLFDEDAVTILAIYIGKRETTTYRRN